ncbi:hypothetical protein BMS3Bbin02_01052 [bacterium BMS3Bbin02]|nr:hypothetical protein BMS3Bbin02_01052 [bacterium BMS3Bbin02]
MDVTEVVPLTDSLIASIFENADYRDGFRVSLSRDPHAGIEGFVTDYFRNQPAWLRLVSMNTMSLSKLARAIGDESYRPGTAIGSWKIYERSTDEIVFGDSMGFMEYRFSLRLSRKEPCSVEVSTSVRYLWRRTGRFYFAIVRPWHKRFIRMSLRHAL